MLGFQETLLRSKSSCRNFLCYHKRAVLDTAGGAGGCVRGGGAAAEKGVMVTVYETCFEKGAQVQGGGGSVSQLTYRLYGRL